MFDMDNHKKIGLCKHILYLCIYVGIVLVILECSLRLFYVHAKGVPFFRPSELVLADYPELRKIYKTSAGSSTEFSILLLGASVLVEKYGHVPSILEDKLRSKGMTNYKIYNLSDLGHNSRDSYLKYKAVSNYKYDVVIIYEAINEVRANNCPPELFKPDYSHSAWYELRNLTEKYRSTINISVIPYSLDYIYCRLKQHIWKDRYIPFEIPSPDWIRYGIDIKTARPYKNNIENIIQISSGKNEAVILMTFSYYIPYEYSNKLFLSHSLDYSYADYSWPIYLWGNTYHVALGIETHNSVIRELARENPFAEFVDMEKIIPKKGKYFSDICHLSQQGSNLFAEALSNKIVEVYKKKNADHVL